MNKTLKRRTILKKVAKEQKREATFLGLYISKEVASFLSLYSLAKGITKTTIVTDEINRWRSERLRDSTDEELIDELVKRSIQAYRKMRKNKPMFFPFCGLVRAELKRKGVAPEIIEKVIKRMIHEKKQG